MWQSFAIFGFSFIVTLFTTPFMIWFSKKVNALDHPMAKLKPQKYAIPNLGGMAIFLGISFTLIFSLLINIIDLEFIISILSCSILILIIGIVDDKYNIKGLKLYTQIVIGIIMALLGIHFNFISSPLLKVITTVCVVVITCNSLNLIDGIDGLASGVVLIASTFFFILFATTGNIGGIILSLALIGSSAAFLIFNFSPASIYLGNNGSLFLGLIVAIMIIIYPSSNNFNYIIAPIVIFSIPITDTMLSFIRRIINGKSFLHGDRSHFYDHLVRNGIPLTKVILMIYISCSVLGGIAILISTMPLLFSLIVFFFITLGFTITIMKMKFYQIID